MINTSSWKEFRVGDFFHGVRGTSRKMQELNEGKTPVIAAARYNQEIAGYYDVPSEYENAITISCNGVGCGSTYYHDYPFAITGDAIVLENIGNVPIGALHFIASVYDVYFSRKYSYTDKCSADKAEAEFILLPATSDGQPDWAYMESYMKAVMEESEKRIENLKKVDDTKNLIDTKDWKIFKLEDLFMISISLSVDKTAFEFDDSYDIDFIGRTSINNGIQGKLYELKYAPNEAGTYSVTQIGTKVCQYRENRWYASQNIFKLVPLDNAMNKASKFLTTVITQALKCTYSDDTYSSYPTLKSLRQQEIKLPVDDNGEPDWVYMEDYMKQIEQKAAKKLELFHKEKIV